MLGCGQDGGPAASGSAATGVRQFAVEGMTCEGCVGTVTSAIKAVPGVVSVAVSLENKKAVVVADFAQAPPSAIEAAVHDAGYEARLIEPQENDPE
jgi:copper chaperone CopZ